MTDFVGDKLATMVQYAALSVLAVLVAWGAGSGSGAVLSEGYFSDAASIAILVVAVLIFVAAIAGTVFAVSRFLSHLAQLILALKIEAEERATREDWRTQIHNQVYGIKPKAESKDAPADATA